MRRLARWAVGSRRAPADAPALVAVHPNQILFQGLVPFRGGVLAEFDNAQDLDRVAATGTAQVAGDPGLTTVAVLRRQ